VVEGKERKGKETGGYVHVHVARRVCGREEGWEEDVESVESNILADGIYALAEGYTRRNDDRSTTLL
jgi:hypothetical protein